MIIQQPLCILQFIKILYPETGIGSTAIFGAPQSPYDSYEMILRKVRSFAIGEEKA